jgi:hypothetical protein
LREAHQTDSRRELAVVTTAPGSRSAQTLQLLAAIGLQRFDPATT